MFWPFFINIRRSTSSMGQTVELSTIDARYEGHRLRDTVRESHLLASISARGIEQPLEGVDTAEGRLLLDGFKRYRCARKLGIDCVPYVSLGDEEAGGILHLMRIGRVKTLGILEQARFIGDLLSLHGLSLAEVAEQLSRSKAWVSMRRDLLQEMGETIERILFRGAFPVYCYMYTLRPFRRMNGISRDDIERFITAVAARRRSVREIELLAHGYFRGPVELRDAIGAGQLDWSLERMRSVPEDTQACSPFERALLKDLEIARKYLDRVRNKCLSPALTSRAFHAQAHLLTGSLLSRWELFQERIRELHDRSGRA
jgi:hypothetical protein